MFKKISLLLLVSLLVLVLGACADSTESETTQPTAESPVSEVAATGTPVAETSVSYPIVDTNQGYCYDGYERIDCPAEGEAFYGQDAQYTGNEPSYTDNGDGTINDNVTGLVWTQEISSYAMPWSDAAGYCESLDTGDVTDWRLPSVKELWSLRDFSQGWPWVDTDYFYLVGDGSELGQHHSWTSNLYLVESEYQNDQVVGDPAWIVNDWTGHIKAMSGNRFVRCVSGDEYGINDFVDNGDGTVTDNATGLIWSQDDSGEALYWEEALAYAEDATIAGYDDWRLPSAKELQSIVDYTATEIPVLDTSIFNLTEVTTTVYDGDEVIDTQVNYPFYWSSTSNPLEAEGEDVDGGTIYAWALASGYNVDMAGYDLHGAGSIVFVSKTEENSGVEDVVPVMVRLVRDGDVTETPDGDPTTVNPDRVVVFEDGEMGNAGGGGQGGQAPDFAAAAEQLGVTEEALIDALGDPSQGPPDFEVAAAALGISAEELEAALMNSSGAPEDGAPAEQPADSSELPADSAATSDITYTLVETGQGFCYNSDGEKIDCPAAGEAFYGQDAQFTGAAFDFTDNGDSTVTDNVTGLTWEQTPNSGPSSWLQAQEYCEALTLGDLDDWRMPSLKELFSISNFSAGWPYLDTGYFDLTVNDSISKDEQYWSSNYYVGKTSEGQYDAAFGVNHATGHIKAYPALVTGPMGKYVRCVSGDEYGINDFADNGDGTITDNATALMWTQADSGEGIEWEAALAYADSFTYAGYEDWRLPNVKELQSIVDYSYAPDAQDEAYDGPALNPLFSVSEITNEAGNLDYPYYWTSTSARFQSTGDFYYAWYIAAGRAVDGTGADSHGAGAVRFDTKSEDGPAGEGGERYYNYVMLVRGGDVVETLDGDPNANDTAPVLEFSGGDQPTDGAPQGSGGPGEMLDYAAAAATLGISEDDLTAALGDAVQGPPDFAAAAATLGMTEADLMDALDIAEGGMPPGGQPPTTTP